MAVRAIIETRGLSAACKGRGRKMGCLGNALWFIFGGLFLGLGWVLAGVPWCITVVGIPIGLQCFKLAKLALMPFGASVS